MSSGVKRNPPTLTRRELEVLKWVAEGKSNSEVAAILGIARGTVNKHLDNILAKLHVENRTAAAAIYNREHLNRTPSLPDR